MTSTDHTSIKEDEDENGTNILPYLHNMSLDSTKSRDILSDMTYLGGVNSHIGTLAEFVDDHIVDDYIYTISCLGGPLNKDNRQYMYIGQEI